MSEALQRAAAGVAAMRSVGTAAAAAQQVAGDVARLADDLGGAARSLSTETRDFLQNVQSG